MCELYDRQAIKTDSPRAFECGFIDNQSTTIALPVSIWFYKNCNGPGQRRTMILIDLLHKLCESLDEC